MEIKDRISYLIKINQLTASSFAQKIGAQPSSISHIISGRNKPSLDLIQKILNEFPKVNADWLISGVMKDTSQMLQSQKKEENALVFDQAKKVETKNEKSESGRKLLKVMLFYSDNTVEEFKHL